MPTYVPVKRTNTRPTYIERQQQLADHRAARKAAKTAEGIVQAIAQRLTTRRGAR